MSAPMTTARDTDPELRDEKSVYDVEITEANDQAPIYSDDAGVNIKKLIRKVCLAWQLRSTLID